MQETYVALGYEVAWAPLMVYPVIVAIQVVYRKVKKRDKVLHRSEIFMSVWVILCTVLSLPLGWGFGGLCLGTAVGVLFSRSTEQPRWPVRIAVACLYLAMAWVFVVWMTFGERIVLTDNEVVWANRGKSYWVPRKGLQVHATGGVREWWESRSSYSWSTFATEPRPEDSIGLHILGSQVFWGPNGYVRGDDVGKRIAAWAGTAPKYRIYP
jgi:hypothetical protein